jgi:ATP-dependent Zn protease
VGTAYHEAGHAVAAYELRLPFRYVTIIPDEEKMTLGHIIYRGFGPDFHPGTIPRHASAEN